MRQLAAYPIVAYAFSFAGTGSLHELFERAGLKIKVALRAHDADVIKTYVRLNPGIGIVARRHMREFMRLLAPHLDRALVERAASFESAQKIDQLLKAVPVPCR